MYKSRRFFDEYSFKQLRRETRGQWQKCYGEASMSIYLLLLLLLKSIIIGRQFTSKLCVSESLKCTPVKHPPPPTCIHVLMQSFQFPLKSLCMLILLMMVYNTRICMLLDFNPIQLLSKWNHGF